MSIHRGNVRDRPLDVHLVAVGCLSPGRRFPGRLIVPFLVDGRLNSARDFVAIWFISRSVTTRIAAGETGIFH